MGLTVTEKEHWKERIELRVKRAIDEIYASKAPKLRDEVHSKAVQAVIDDFGIADDYAKVKELKRQAASAHVAVAQ